MPINPYEMPLLADIRGLNRGFLALLTQWAPPAAAAPCGLDGAVVAELRALTADQLDLIAATPGLLACFNVPAPSFQVADQGPQVAALASWNAQARRYATCLLTWLWQLEYRRGAGYPLGSASRATAGRRGRIDFASIDREAELAPVSLNARFCHHRLFWPQLISSVRSGNEEFVSFARLTIIPLSIAEQHPA